MVVETLPQCGTHIAARCGGGVGIRTGRLEILEQFTHFDLFPFFYYISMS
jgi:hypothetical protein